MSRDVKEFAAHVLDGVRSRMFGVDEVARLCLTALFTGGHVLLEGNPGLGKTELVKTLSQVLGFPNGRIQFTPDLMPADITGTYMPDFKGTDSRNMVFQPGPIFTSLLLADEINRATPKTQSAMLEAMAEQQVTVLGRRYRLSSPFMVLATQNPIDHEGTYALPEAQADRFMFKVHVPTPNAKTLRLILNKTAGAGAVPVEMPKHLDNPLFGGDRKQETDRYEQYRRRIEDVEPLALVETHILNMFLASNRNYEELQGLDKKQVAELKDLVEDYMVYGLGPRAARDLMLGAKAWSLFFLSSAENAEGPALARISIATLRHRIKLRYDWEDHYRKSFKNLPAGEDELLDRFIAHFVLAAAPKTHEYSRIFQDSLERGLK